MNWQRCFNCFWWYGQHDGDPKDCEWPHINLPAGPLPKSVEVLPTYSQDGQGCECWKPQKEATP